MNFSMEPMLPPEGGRVLEDLAVDLARESGGLAGRLHPNVRRAVGALVRSMNCYYSNLIEGHDTHPRDIERALAQEYSTEPRKRDLQLEAVAHIAVQEQIDTEQDPQVHPASTEYARWLHREFCSRLPDEMLWVETPGSGELLAVVPGDLRQRDVEVGRHVPPGADELPAFLLRFEQSYEPARLSRVRQLVAIAAAHHRFLWIHPFLDGNGRVARLMSHALLRRAGVGSSLWSVSRGLARNVDRYTSLLMAADERDAANEDGQGPLSGEALARFCEFFLSACLDQVRFMAALLEPAELLRRIELYADDELPKGSGAVLREALLAGAVERGRAAQLTGYRERAARDVLAALLQRGLLIADGPRSPLRLGFPIEVVERWFPRLYPSAIG